MNEVFSFRNIPKEPQGKEGAVNGGRSKVDIALAEREKEFWEKSSDGRFLRKMEGGKISVNNALKQVGVSAHRRMDFLISLIEKGYADIEKVGNKLIVEKIHMENIKRRLEEKLYDKKLLEFIKAEENQGMSIALLGFYTKRGEAVLRKKTQKLIDLGLIIDARPASRKSTCYFSPDFVIEGKPGQTTVKMLAVIRKRIEEFEEIQGKSKTADPSRK